MSGAPEAQACGLQAVGYSAGKPVCSRGKPGERLREAVAEQRGRLEQTHRQIGPPRSVPVPRERQHRDGRVVRPDGAEVVADRVVADLAGGERAHAPAGVQPVAGQERRDAAATRSSSTMPVHSRCPMFEVRLSTGFLSPSSARA